MIKMFFLFDFFFLYVPWEPSSTGEVEQPPNMRWKIQRPGRG